MCSHWILIAAELSMDLIRGFICLIRQMAISWLCTAEMDIPMDELKKVADNLDVTVDESQPLEYVDKELKAKRGCS